MSRVYAREDRFLGRPPSKVWDGVREPPPVLRLVWFSPPAPRPNYYTLGDGTTGQPGPTEEPTGS